MTYTATTDVIVGPNNFGKSKDFCNIVDAVNWVCSVIDIRFYDVGIGQYGVNLTLQNNLSQYATIFVPKRESQKQFELDCVAAYQLIMQAKKNELNKTFGSES